MTNEVVHLSCEHCGDKYHRREKYADESRFCSRSCSAQWHAENNPDSGPNLDPTDAKKEPRAAALRRDEHACKRCGEDVGPQRDTSTRDVEVHHLIPKSAGGTDHLDNLVTLCSHCHTKVHGDMRRIPQNHPELLEELREVVCDE